MPDQRRRKFLRNAGIAVGLGTSLAGCTGGDGGGGGGGGDGGGDGDGGDGGDGGGGQMTTQQQLQDITIGFPPWGPYNLVIAHSQEEGIWDEEFNDAGYNVDVQATWEDATLFAAGKTNVSAISTVEATSMAKNNNREFTAFGEQVLPPHGYLVKVGGPYDAANTGGQQATMDKLVEDQAKFGIGSWSAGSLPYGKIAIEQLFGYDLSEEGDFNVIAVDYAAMPKLLMQDELAIGMNSPLHGAAPQLAAGDLTGLWWDINLWTEEFGAVPPLGNFIMDTEYFEENRAAAEAMLRVFQRSNTWIWENVDSIAESDQAVEALPVETKEAAKVALDWMVKLTGEWNEYIWPPDPAMSQDDVDANSGYLDLAADYGGVPSDWNDYISYESIDTGIDVDVPTY